MAYALKHENGVVLHADVKGAYVKSPLRGRPMMMRLDKNIHPRAWQHMSDPVVRVY